ncbi:Nif11-like leader peptide family natural product precursor [Chlorobium sp. N1]|uniref:Nif11-like leader peptide family natural product precursor n=1 Tax=Chlorobium sp. N1 TaxID=2491138 RepID=UPI00103F7871|nr:Nif11-like leader peptide family natural product precursor [Chlorobium sp. N1]TCD47034.1 Nif11-like leader peptide family natural product precursor [Chlorobium sp. N1]
MSREQAKAFIERMKTDDAFHRKIMAIEDPEERIACIRSEGFSCTADEINDVAQDGSGNPGSVMAGALPSWCGSLTMDDL